MKIIQLIILGSLLILLLSCSSSDISGGTQTGNPITAKLNYYILSKDCFALRANSSPLNDTLTNITISSVEFSIYQVELEGIEKSVSFSLDDEIPFLINLNLTGNKVLLDTLLTDSQMIIESFEIEIGPIEPYHGKIFTDNPHMQHRSVQVKGFLNDNPADSFTFNSAVEVTIEREFEPPFNISENEDNSLSLEFRVNKWFTKSSGGLLDPRKPSNLGQIEDNIENSINLIIDSAKRN